MTFKKISKFGFWYICIICSESQDKTYKSIVRDFEKMIRLELEEAGEQLFGSGIVNRNMGMFKEAYKEVYEKKCGVKL